MGLFDYLHCKYPLPVEGANALEFQTKDTPAQYMDHYEVREDGTLWHEVYNTEDRSDPNAEGFFKMFGMATRVNERWERVTDFTGEICFYTGWTNRYNDPKHKPGWIEFSSYFADGKLKELNVLENRAAEDIA